MANVIRKVVNPQDNGGESVCIECDKDTKCVTISCGCYGVSAAQIWFRDFHQLLDAINQIDEELHRDATKGSPHWA